MDPVVAARTMALRGHFRRLLDGSTKMDSYQILADDLQLSERQARRVKDVFVANEHLLLSARGRYFRRLNVFNNEEVLEQFQSHCARQEKRLDIDQLLDELNNNIIPAVYSNEDQAKMKLVSSAFFAYPSRHQVFHTASAPSLCTVLLPRCSKPFINRSHHSLSTLQLQPESLLCNNCCVWHNHCGSDHNDSRHNVTVQVSLRCLVHTTHRCLLTPPKPRIVCVVVVCCCCCCVVVVVVVVVVHVVQWPGEALTLVCVVCRRRPKLGRRNRRAATQTSLSLPTATVDDSAVKTGCACWPLSHSSMLYAGEDRSLADGTAEPQDTRFSLSPLRS
jgi:hypothetical protein